MLKEALDVFEEMLSSEEGERMVIDSYTPKDGTYLLIRMDTKKVLCQIDVNNKKKIGKSDYYYPIIREVDYYSKLLEMNKPIDPKKVIHSNNYLSFSVKKESIAAGKLTSEIIKEYYKILKNPMLKYEKKPKAKELYRSVEEKIGVPDTSLISEIEAFILGEDFKAILDNLNLDEKAYLKVFFVFSDVDDDISELEKTREYYKKENERYLVPNIYNNNKFNISDEGMIFGLPNNNMGMNTKKPFLENKSRKVKVPYLLNEQDTLLQHKFFDYLMGQVDQKKYHIYIDNMAEDIHAYSNTEEPDELESGYYIQARKEKNEVEIIKADVVTHYSNKITGDFRLHNYMEVPEEYDKYLHDQYEEKIEDLWKVKAIIDYIFFGGKLQFNFTSDVRDIKVDDEVVKMCLLESRDAFARWFWQGDSTIIEDFIDKLTLRLIRNSVVRSKITAAQKQFNVRWALLEYFQRGNVGDQMVEVRKQLDKHIHSALGEEWNFESDKEFAYAVGQGLNYLLFLSQAGNKNHSFINQILNAKDVELIKKRMLQLYKRYNYRIQFYAGSPESQLFHQIMLYEPEKIETEYILAGFAGASLIIKSKGGAKDE